MNKEEASARLANILNGKKSIKLGTTNLIKLLILM